MSRKPKKSLGQNFLIDKNIIHKIIYASEINSNDEILEVGPGTGNLTELIISKNLTKYFASRFALNLSLISLWSDKSIEVFKTFFALDENHSVITIIAPAKNSITFGVSTLEDSTSSVSWSGGIPEISHAS